MGSTRIESLRQALLPTAPLLLGILGAVLLPLSALAENRERHSFSPRVEMTATGGGMAAAAVVARKKITWGENQNDIAEEMKGLRKNASSFLSWGYQKSLPALRESKTWAEWGWERLKIHSADFWVWAKKDGIVFVEMFAQALLDGTIWMIEKTLSAFSHLDQDEGAKASPQGSSNLLNYYSLKKSAEKGDPQAQINLGILYLNGGIVPKDHVEAYKWFKVSSTHLDFQTKKQFLELKDRMTVSDLTEANIRARNYMRRQSASPTP